MRVLYFDFWSDASSFYQLMPLDYLKSDRFTIERSTEREITPYIINRYDCFIFIRTSDDAQLIAIRRIKDMGKKVITIFDDDCINLPNDIHPMYEHYESNKSKTIECIVLSDEVWVSTAAIKHSFRMYNPNIQLIPNAHNDLLFKVKKKPKFKYNKIALWRGGHSHLNDIYEGGTTEYIIHLINDNKDWRWHFWGQRFEFIEKRIKQANHYRSKGGPALEFYQSMHMLNPCAFFYPLADSLFNRSKSNCSMLEGVYSGAAYFGSGLPEFEKPGVLPFTEMGELIGDTSLLEKSHNESWQYICDELLLSKVNELRKQRLEEI